MLLLSLHESPLHATDTLTVTQPLSGDRKLISQNGSFALGFFQPTGEPFFFPILCFSCWAYLSLLYGSLARQIKFTQLDSNINPSRIWTCSGLHNMIFFIVASMFFIKLWSHINSTTKRVIPFSHSFTFFPRSLTTTLPPPPATRPFALCLSTPWAQAPRNASSLSFVDRRPSSDMLVVAWLEGLGCRN